MKYRTVVERIGERLGDIDWSYDFASHAWGPNKGGMNPEQIPIYAQRLRELEAAFKAGKKVGVTNYGDHFDPVIDVGMYDGWPAWKPTPSFCSTTWLGACWHPWYSIGQLRIEEPA